MNSDTQNVDFLKRPLQVGQTIVYPIRSGSYMAMHKAIITEVHEGYIKALYDTTEWRGAGKDAHGNNVYKHFPVTRKVKIVRLNRVVIV